MHTVTPTYICMEERRVNLHLGSEICSFYLFVFKETSSMNTHYVELCVCVFVVTELISDMQAESKIFFKAAEKDLKFSDVAVRS